MISNSIKRWKTKCGLDAEVKIFNPEQRICNQWYCGYVYIKRDNLLFGISYSFADAKLTTHKGITLSDSEIIDPLDPSNDIWCMGFDCGHADDTMESCPLEYVEERCESLAEQLIKYQIKKVDASAERLNSLFEENNRLKEMLRKYIYKFKEVQCEIEDMMERANES